MTLKYDHLRGLEFDDDKRNCYTLLRDFYQDNYGIELTDYPNPKNWQHEGLDLYGTLAETEGFEVISMNPRTWQAGDVLIMAINSSVGSHAAIVLDTGEILHHLYNQLSGVTNFGGVFRNNLVAVYRHKDVPAANPSQNKLDYMELLPRHVREQLERKRAENEVGS